MESRPALGRIALLGSLYNARSETPVALSLFDGQLPPSCVSTTPIRSVDLRSSYVDSYKEKFEKMGIPPDSGESFLAGLVHPAGSSCYLRDTHQADQYLRASIYHTWRTIQDDINLMNSSIKDFVASPIREQIEATHVIVGIEWGITSVVSISSPFPSDIAPSCSAGQLRRQVDALISAVKNSNPPENREPIGQDETETSFVLTVYSDALQDEGVIVYDIQEAYEFIDLIAADVGDGYSGKGKALSYKLLPLGILSMFQIPAQLNVNSTFISPGPDSFHRFADLFDRYQSLLLQLGLKKYYAAKYERYHPNGHAKTIASEESIIRSKELIVRSRYGVLLQETRCGKSTSQDLRQLAEAFAIEQGTITRTAGQAGALREKGEYIDALVKKGATYIGYNGLNLDKELSRRQDGRAYVFRINTAAKKDEYTWRANTALLLDLLSGRTSRDFVAILDCEATGNALEASCISEYSGQEVLVQDMFRQREFLADKCLAGYDAKNLETEDVQKPIKRRFIKIPCPGLRCDKSAVCDWLCSRCLVPIEYGYSDPYFYCDCGRVLYQHYGFKCSNQLHGQGYDRYDPNKISAMLRKLDQTNCLNVLILGETGVGKSTFINAFLNYLTFDTLDSAKDATDLHWLIPCSFEIQKMDRSGQNGNIERHEIHVGSRDDERDGSKGDSATQQTTVYPVTIGSRTIRLIDTPGIGDTRGLEYDQKNMADIITTLSSYETLHGILILLKSNSARLTILFSFCVKELLTHLHRSAVENMAFGFTNTRISNYTPGDTFGPLDHLLKQHPDVGLTLQTPTTYCFDSEGFRYIAAFKNGIQMDNEEDFRRSWKHSRDEAWRLINHFGGRPPHRVESTVSLYSTRQLIIELTKPMAEISQLIQTNITLCEDKVQELKNNRLTGEELRKKLKLQKVQLHARKLDRPRTVCNSASCKEYKDDGNCESKQVVVYKSHCHPTCYLQNVKADVVGCPELIDCAAFMGKTNCSRCHHHWQEHLHTLYELEESIKTFTDSNIEKQLRAHANDITLKQTAIDELRQRVREYQNEHSQIREAAAHFGIFLKAHSITTINDLTIAYIDFLIRQEEDLVNAGGRSRKLKSLQKDRQKHLELVDALTRSMAEKPGSRCSTLSGRDVNSIVRKLYSLKHFGENLKLLKETIALAHQATNREIPYRVKGFGHGHQRKHPTRHAPGVHGQLIVRPPGPIAARLQSRMMPVRSSEKKGVVGTILRAILP